MTWCAAFLLLVPQVPALQVVNTSAATRSETVRASLPLPRGKFRKLDFVGVAGDCAPAVPLAWWPDKSLAVVQIHARVSLAAGATVRLPIEFAPKPKASRREGEAQRAWPWSRPAGAKPLPLRTELVDPWGEVYTAEFQVDSSAGKDGFLMATSRVRVRRFIGRHRAGDKQFLGLLAYLTTFANSRRAELTVVLDNDSHVPGLVLGPVRLQEFALVTTRADVKLKPRMVLDNGLPGPDRYKKGWRQPLLRKSQHVYLGDRTAKAWRVDLFLDGEKVTEAERAQASLAVAHPLVALPDLDWVRMTRGYHAHGGPAPGPGRPTAAGVFLQHAWRARADTGAFGSFGDPKDAARQGTPRNGAGVLHNVLRFGSPVLLRFAEGMALQQTLRPPASQKVRGPATTAALRQGLTPRTMQRPHGFTGPGYEHFSADLLYEYYWLTGDPLARRELQRLGRGLRRVLVDLPFLTCRGEGWCMQAAVLIARATGDDALVQRVHRRFEKTVYPAVQAAPAHCVLPQPPHPDALDGKMSFDCPWQMAAWIYGAHAMFEQTGDKRYAEVTLRAARAIAGPGWIRGRGPKYYVSAKSPDVFEREVGSRPLEGTAVMLVGALELAAQMTGDLDEAQLFRRRAAVIVAPHESLEPQRAAMNTWFQIYLDQRGARR